MRASGHPGLALTTTGETNTGSVIKTHGVNSVWELSPIQEHLSVLCASITTTLSNPTNSGTRMLLRNAHVTLYRSVEDSDEFNVESDVTCLVGKNESGKTAVLQALYKLNPVEKSAVFDEVIDFPSRLTRQRKSTTGHLTAIKATFELTHDAVSYTHLRAHETVLDL